VSLKITNLDTLVLNTGRCSHSPKQLAYNNHSFIVFNLSNGTCESMHDSLDSAQKKIIELLDKSEKIETGEKKPTGNSIFIMM
ncbi:hypothetical protein AB0T22_23485, partial [Escherichia coli]